MDNFDAVVREIFDNLIGCPKYEQCVSARGGVLPWGFCAMYGCNTYREHSAYNKIMGINGFKGSRDEVLEAMMREGKTKGWLKIK